jgi:hypothetical protein
MIVSVWSISAFLSFFPIFANLYTNEKSSEKIDKLNYVYRICKFKVNFKYSIVSSIIMFWLPGFGMIVFYFLLMFKAKNFLSKETIKTSQLTLRASRIPPEFYTHEFESLTNRFKRKSSHGILTRYENWRKEYRLYKTLGTKMIVFFFCWFFFFLNYTICNDEILPCESYFGKRVYIIIVDILFWIGYLNSMANFFMYALGNKDFDR